MVKDRFISLPIQLAILVFTAVLAVLLFLSAYHFDNKYTEKAPAGNKGVLRLSDEDLERDTPLHLTYGWEYYYGKLLTPEDFSSSAPVPDQYVAIGQYGGLEAGDATRSPHGSATYRLTLMLPETPASYGLELPEIYSAYRLYINGQESASMGTPEAASYEPLVQSGCIYFEASKETEILFSVSDWSHFYSGLTYPPAFGKAESLQSLMNLRSFWYQSLLVLAVLLGIHQFVLFCLSKNSSSLLFSLICISFAGTVCSPVLHSLMATAIQPWYGLETFCRYTFYWLTLLLISKLCQVRPRTFWTAVILGGMFPFIAWTVYLLAPSLTYGQMGLFSCCASAYKLLCSLWMLFCTLKQFYKRLPGSLLLSCAVLIQAVSLAMDRILPLFEPIRFGWFSEISGLLFLILLAFRIWYETAQTYRTQGILEEEKRQLSMRLDMQKSYYQVITEQVTELHVLRHDLRHHLNAVRGLLSEPKDSPAVSYLDSLYEAPVLHAPVSFCSFPALDAILCYYDALADRQNIGHSFSILLPDTLMVDEQDLCVIFGNLLENALEAWQRIPGKNPTSAIRFSVSYRYDNLFLELQNPCCGPYRFQPEQFPSSKSDSRKGMGLASVKSIAEIYGGELSVHTEKSEKQEWIFTARVFLLNIKKENRSKRR